MRAVPVRPRPVTAVALAAAGLATALVTGVCVGVVGLPPGAALVTLADRALGLHLGGGLDPVTAEVLLALRVPRVLVAAVAGGLLAIAGAAYQGVFRNPLADPYLLGAAAGAGLGATLVMSYAPARSWGPVGFTPLAAFAGALLGVGLSLVVGSVAGRDPGGASLLLAGVSVASFLTAVQTGVQQANTDDLAAVFAWVQGQLGRSSWTDLALVLPYALGSVAVLLAMARTLDVLAVGEEEAASLGVRPGRVRLVVLVAAALATGTAVALGGLIAFVGLVVPHLVRRVAGASYLVVLPVSLLGGAGFLVLADVVARTALAPAELPIGVVTAFVGGPFFILLLRTTRPA